MKFRLVEDIASVKNYYSNIDAATFNHLISIDPTYIPNSDRLGKYGKWLLNIYRSGNFVKYKDTNTFNDKWYSNILKQFEAKKDMLPNDQRDIGKYNSLDKVIDLSIKLNDTPYSYSLKQILRQAEHVDLNTDIEKVFENDEWEIYKPLTYTGSVYLGHNTNWCTAKKSINGIIMYIAYTGDTSIINKCPEVKQGLKEFCEQGGYVSPGSPLYVLINKITTDKYQFNMLERQFMDSNDEPIDVDKFIEENPSLKDFIRKNYYL